MAPLKPDNVLRLRDGRLLGYGEYGDAAGRPLFFFHGFPGSRLQAAFGAQAATSAGVHVIAPERPGYGLSDFKPDRTLLDWPDDVLELAEALGIERFAIAGISGGGPYAAACALKFPERLLGAGIISGLGPLDARPALDGMEQAGRWLFGLAARVPALASVPLWLMGQAALHFPDRYLALTTRGLSEADRQILSRPEVRAGFMQDIAEALRSGSRGVSWDAVVYVRPWGFRLEDIRIPVHLWQGEADTAVPPSMGHQMAERIPDCRATFYPGEGHFLAVDRLEGMLATLLGEQPAPETATPDAASASGSTLTTG